MRGREDCKEEEIKVNNGGWHFSIFDWRKIREKLSSFAHSEFDTEEINNVDYLNDCISKLKHYIPYFTGDMKLEEFAKCDLPAYVGKNRDKFKDYILEVSK